MCCLATRAHLKEKEKARASVLYVARRCKQNPNSLALWDLYGRSEKTTRDRSSFCFANTTPIKKSATINATHLRASQKCNRKKAVWRNFSKC